MGLLVEGPLVEGPLVEGPLVVVEVDVEFVSPSVSVSVPVEEFNPVKHPETPAKLKLNTNA